MLEGSELDLGGDAERLTVHVTADQLTQDLLLLSLHGRGEQRSGREPRQTNAHGVTAPSPAPSRSASSSACRRRGRRAAGRRLRPPKPTATKWKR